MPWLRNKQFTVTRLVLSPGASYYVYILSKNPDYIYIYNKQYVAFYKLPEKNTSVAKDRGS